jgi:translation elongation factor EF-Ts
MLMLLKMLQCKLLQWAPVALDKDGVDADTLQREIEIGKEQARAEGKPEDMLEKIALGVN